MFHTLKTDKAKTMDWMNEGEGRSVYRLSELSAELKSTLQGHFRKPIWIKAEISELKAGQKGHYYLQLVDKQYGVIEAQIRANIWASSANRIIPYFENATGTRLSKGMTVLFQGAVTFHTVYGLSINIQYIDPEYTLGEMAREKDAVIARLRKEGFWDMNRELVVPDVPQRMAVIAAPGSKGLNDFNKTIQTLCPGVQFHITLFSAIMQGENAAPDIIRNLRIIEDQFQQYDAIILIRGGGAELDLKCFDEYELCAIMAQVSLPVVTGIGHTDDETICDLIASVRRKTPTDTAVFIGELINNFTDRIKSAEESICRYAREMLEDAKMSLTDIERRIDRQVKSEMRYQDKLIGDLTMRLTTSAGVLIRENRRKLENDTLMINQRSARIISEQRNQLDKDLAIIKAGAKSILQKENSNTETFSKMVRLMHPDNVLKRGYSITLKNGKAVTGTDELTPGDELETKLHHGSVTSIITKKNNK